MNSISISNHFPDLHEWKPFAPLGTWQPWIPWPFSVDTSHLLHWSYIGLHITFNFYSPESQVILILSNPSNLREKSVSISRVIGHWVPEVQISLIFTTGTIKLENLAKWWQQQNHPILPLVQILQIKKIHIDLGLNPLPLQLAILSGPQLIYYILLKL